MKNELQIQVEGDIGQGVYSNLQIITHNDTEFVVDFCRTMPHLSLVKVHSRVIMTPKHAKIFQRTLEDNLKRFEERFGKIKITDSDIPNIGFRPQEESEQKP